MQEWRSSSVLCNIPSQNGTDSSVSKIVDFLIKYHIFSPIAIVYLFSLDFFTFWGSFSTVQGRFSKKIAEQYWHFTNSFILHPSSMYLCLPTYIYTYTYINIRKHIPTITIISLLHYYMYLECWSLLYLLKNAEKTKNPFNIQMNAFQNII